MVALRRKVDAALKSKPQPEHWPRRDLWAAPEYLIWSVLRGIAVLESDGVTEAGAVRQVDARRRFNVLAPGTDAITPEEYLERLLRKVAPGYLEHGSDLLADTIVVARDGLRELPPSKANKSPEKLSPEPWTTPNGCPPSDWRWKRMAPERERKMFDRGPPLVPRSACDEEVFDLVVRTQPGDELWEWSSPPPTWRFKMGRGGVALVRNGRVIAHVVTIMN
jgi:hypothetical protein